MKAADSKPKRNEFDLATAVVASSMCMCFLVIAAVFWAIPMDLILPAVAVWFVKSAMTVVMAAHVFLTGRESWVAFVKWWRGEP